MPTYRARSCPNCNYYLGFTVAKPPFKTTQVSVNGLCLNCGYKIPIHAIMLGTRRARTATGLGQRKTRKLGASDGRRKFGPVQAESLPPPAYAVDLRAIGQELERLQANDFNLECAGDSYWVWVRQETVAPASSTQPDRLTRLWKRNSGNEWQVPKAPMPAFLAPNKKTARHYDPADIELIDRGGKARRRPESAITDGHSLSQSLRTLGAVVNQRGQKLLAISWQKGSISIVVETPQGQRQLDVFRHDNIYDLWVKRYLKRASRAYSDVPT